MAFHCGAPTRDGSACQRHVREPGTRCPQHRNLGGVALPPPRFAMRTIILLDPALADAPSAWISARAELAARAEELRDRVTEEGGQQSGDAEAGSHGEGEAADVATPVGRLSYLDRERAERNRLVRVANGGDAEPEPAGERQDKAGGKSAGEDAVAEEAEPEGESAGPVGRRSYLDRERAVRRQSVAPESELEPELEPEAEPELEPELAEPNEPGEQADQREPVAESEAEPESRRVEQRPLLRRERALDPDWIGGRPLFRDEAPTQPMPRIEFEPSEPAAPAKPPRISPMRSVVLNPDSDPAAAKQHSDSVPKVKPVPDSDPPTLIDRMPPIDPDELEVPDFLRPDFAESSLRPQPQPLPKPESKSQTTPKPARAPEPKPRPKPAPRPKPQRDDPSLRDTSAPDIPLPDISVPDFIISGFSEPVAKPPLRTVLSTVLGPDLWQRCYAEWGAAHCMALARIARTVDGLAPSAGTAVRSTAGAGMRWLGVARERDLLADQVADAISHPAGATVANQARTVRLYGAAICVALHLPLRRCACHRDLERDVSSELIRLGLEELAGEVH